MMSKLLKVLPAMLVAPLLELGRERLGDGEHQVARGVVSIHGARRRGVADQQRRRRAAQTDGDRQSWGVEPK